MYYIYGKSKAGEVPRAVPIKVEENAVVKSLRNLANHGYGVPKRIGLVLEHKYNPRVFSSEGLKGTVFLDTTSISLRGSVRLSVPS